MINILTSLVGIYSIVLVGCGNNQTDVVQIVPEPLPVQEVKELSIAEREALFEAKKKADHFYAVYDHHKLGNMYAKDIESRFLNEIKANPNLTTWKDDDLLQMSSSWFSRMYASEKSLREDIDTYDYLVNVTPELVREKTPAERERVQNRLREMKTELDMRIKEFTNKHKPAIEAELARRNYFSPGSR